MRRSNECIIDEYVRNIDTLCCEDWVQHIEMPFTPFSRAMLDAHSFLC